MKGFFTKKEGQSTKRPDGRSYSCASCGLYQKCKSPKQKPVGGFKKGIINVVSTPTETEDRQGKPFEGSRYKLLEKLYARNKISLREDCLNTYAVRCSTHSPKSYSIDCCRRHLIKLIEKEKPRIVFLYGYEAIYAIIGQRWKKDIGFTTEYQKQTGGKWQGYIIPDQDLRCWLVPVFDIDFLNDKQGGVEQVLFEQNIKQAFEKLTVPFLKFEPPVVEYLTEDKLHILNTIDTDSAFDYETTGIKPYAKGHRIVCASIAYGSHNVYTFLLPKTREKRKPFINFLKREDIKKVAQNLKYEDTWSNVRLKTTVKEWEWDTMLASHIIDNRPGIAGLKFQSYVRFGIIDYDSDVEPYLKSIEDKNGNSHNRIMELLETEEGTKKLLTYCAWDSILEYRLWKLQEKIINKTQPVGSKYGSNIVNAYKLFHEGILALGEAERQGLRIDIIYAEQKTKLLTKKIKRIEEEFFNSNFYRRWKHSIGNKTPNLNSGNQLGRYLYSVLKLEPQKTTPSGKGSTDEEALQLLKIPELDLMLQRSKLRKLRDTYLKAFAREQTNEVLHPFFNLHIARTYRSSSSNPNFQNIPKRDKEAQKIVRRAIYPRIGHQLLEVDYSGIEVSIAACYHKDENMIRYITDPKSDMHGDIAAQIFEIDNFDKHNAEHKLLRSAAKNTFVFPQFYGDYYRNNAIGMCSTWLQLPQTKWTNKMGVLLNNEPIGKHLRNIGIKSFEAFVTKIKRIEKDFWTNRFPQYASWKEEWYEMYLRYGYVPLKTGFVCSGLMGKNEVINYPVQGAAFHCLLWSFVEINKEIKRLGLQTRLVGQIHDAIVFDVYPAELEQIGHLVQKIGTIELRKHFDWINVPLSLEAELCDIDTSWSQKQEWQLPEINSF